MSAVKERPILFPAPMVRALLASTKTQTRRAVKPQPIGVVEVASGNHLLDYRHSYSQEDGIIPIEEMTKRCPYGRHGDRLWVREAWRIGAWDEGRGALAIDYCDGPRQEWLIPSATKTEESHEVFERLWIDSSDELHRRGIHHYGDGRYRWEPGESPLRWRPSIHMPRWASRILLEVTGVRVERLQDIRESDAVAEGVEQTDTERYERDFAICPQCGGTGLYDAFGANWGVLPDTDCTKCDTHVKRYQHLWERINGAGSWDTNPFVWVVEFRRAA